MFFKRVDVGIFLDSQGARISVTIRKGASVIESYTKSYLGIGYRLSQEAITLLNTLQKKHPHTYVGISAVGERQGIVVRECRDTAACEHLPVDPDMVELRCLDSATQSYMGKSDIANLILACYETGGTDFVFSPFAVLWEIVLRHPREGVVVWVMMQKDALLLGIADRGQLIFDGVRLFRDDADPYVDDMEGLIAHADTIDKDVVDEFDEIRLDDLDFDMNREVVIEEPMPDESADLGGTDETQLFASSLVSFVQTAIRSFYDHAECHGRFIDRIVLLGNDEVGDPAFFARQIEHATMIEVSVERADLSEAVAHLVAMEETA